eukprot:g4527.t1
MDRGQPKGVLVPTHSHVGPHEALQPAEVAPPVAPPVARPPERRFPACTAFTLPALAAGGEAGGAEEAKPLSAARRGPPWPGAAGDRERQEKMRIGPRAPPRIWVPNWPKREWMLGMGKSS